MDLSKQTLTLRFTILGVLFYSITQIVFALVINSGNPIPQWKVLLFALITLLLAAIIGTLVSKHRAIWIGVTGVSTAVIACTVIAIETNLRFPDVAAQLGVGSYVIPAIRWLACGLAAAWVATALPKDLRPRRKPKQNSPSANSSGVKPLEL
ncbi:MAG: hypothetical protein LCH41_07205 [Armatimonadetes bacterium]|nr:hypothetical protein [Armatimonadota bacterium]